MHESGKVCQPKTDILTTEQCSQHHVMHHSDVITQDFILKT